MVVRRNAKYVQVEEEKRFRKPTKRSRRYGQLLSDNGIAGSRSQLSGEPLTIESKIFGTLGL